MWIKQVIPQVTASARLRVLYSWILFLCDILAMISPVFPVMTALSHFFLPFTLHPGHHSQLLQLPLAHWGAGIQQVLRRRKHQTNLGKMTGLAGRTTLTLVSGAHTAASLAGRSNFCLCLISGLKKSNCRNWVSSQPLHFCQACFKLHSFKLTKEEEGSLLEIRHLLNTSNLGMQTPLSPLLVFFWINGLV